MKKSKFQNEVIERKKKKYRSISVFFYLNSLDCIEIT